MLRIQNLFIVLIVGFLVASVPARANQMSIFLKSAAYGTAAGAVLGLTTLAWSENPTGKMSNVARGASLGLYAGIGFGLYTIYGQSQKSNSDYVALPFRMWISPVQTQRQIDGAQINWAHFSF